jgi:TatD DNase family protein
MSATAAVVAGEPVELIDSHAHVDGPEFDADRDLVLARARAAGVRRIVVIGAVGDIASAERAVALAERDPDVFATIATHPHDAAQLTEAWWAVHERLARHPRVVAIGETGLDFYYDHAPREAQAEAFRRFVALARAVGKPVVCHVRDAHAEARAILAEAGAAEVGGIIHCFTGTPDDAAAYVELGFHVSFSGIVTYKNAQDLRDAVPLVPRERLLIETDCPYLAPVPRRGKRNEPGFLPHTAEVVARCAGISFDDLAAATTANAARVFGLPPA